jgi:dTDP-4-dehydrorhamnose 3,5-epimerase
MEVEKTGIDGLVVLKPRLFNDARGYFFESFNAQAMQDAGLPYSFVQDNQSKSSQGVVRGLHFQKPPHAQTKLVRVLEGEIFDVAVDLRAGSDTYGKWYGVKLSAENSKQLLVPKGFAHGFSVLSAYAVVLYKCDSYYSPQSDAGIAYNDTSLAIDWQLGNIEPLISDKDRGLPLFADFSTPF